MANPLCAVESWFAVIPRLRRDVCGDVDCGCSSLEWIKFSAAGSQRITVLDTRHIPFWLGFWQSFVGISFVGFCVVYYCCSSCSNFLDIIYDTCHAPFACRLPPHFRSNAAFNFCAFLVASKSCENEIMCMCVTFFASIPLLFAQLAIVFCQGLEICYLHVELIN